MRQLRVAAWDWPAALALVVFGVVAAWAVHWRVLDYGFVYDDYSFLRPLSGKDVIASFHGTWDPSGVQVAFFRPLTVLLHKVRFDLFQFDARAYHWLSICLVGCASGLLGLWIARVAGRWWIGAVGVVVIAAYPSGVVSMVAWITNQMHALQAIVIAVALNWWWSVRERGTIAWLPLLLLQTAAFLIKEDGIMLLPAVFILHAFRPGATGMRRLPPWPVLLMTLPLFGGLFWWRAYSLSGLGGYGGALSLDRAVSFLTAGPKTVALLPVDVGPVAWLVVIVVLAVSIWKRTPAVARAGYLISAGLLIIALWNLPFVFVTKPEQYYALTLGAGVAITGALYGLWELVPGNSRQIVVAVAATAWLAAAVYDDRLLARQYSPTHGYVRETDEIARGWPLPSELLDYLALKAAALKAHRPPPQLLDVVTTVSYGMHASENDAAGAQLRWTTDHATMFVNRRLREFSFDVCWRSQPQRRRDRARGGRWP